MARSAATVKKTYNLPPELVRRVKKVLDAKTETEAIVRCMQQVAFMDDVERAVRETDGVFPDFGPSPSPISLRASRTRHHPGTDGERGCRPPG
jgi:hypothetical protein